MAMNLTGCREINNQYEQQIIQVTRNHHNLFFLYKFQHYLYVHFIHT
jgi:hypothetical protein